MLSMEDLHKGKYPCKNLEVKEWGGCMLEVGVLSELMVLQTSLCYSTVHMMT